MMNLSSINYYEQKRKADKMNKEIDKVIFDFFKPKYQTPASNDKEVEMKELNTTKRKGK